MKLLKNTISLTKNIITLSYKMFHSKNYKIKINSECFSKSSLFKNYLKGKRFSIFVKTLETPNPNFLKFLPGKPILPEGETYDISNKTNALVSPLATKLFEIKGVTRVFYANEYISVGKEELVDWADLKPMIIDEIVKNFTNDINIFLEKPEDNSDYNENDSEVVKLIKEIIAARIRPVVQEDGGDIKFFEFDEEKGIVYLEMKGSCSGCPSSGVTLKNGIEKMLTHYVAEVKSVEQVEEDINE